MLRNSIVRQLRNVALLVPVLVALCAIAAYYGMDTAEESQSGLEFSAGVFQLKILSEMHTLIFGILVLAAGSTAFAIVYLLFKIRKRISDSIVRLGEAMNQVNMGLSPNLALNGFGEFAVMSQTFDVMANAVDSRYKTLFNQLQEKADGAARASKAKSDFLANMSHEIRTPLSVIEGYSSLLRDPKYPDKSECVAKIHWNIRHVTKLVDDILSLANVEAGKPDLFLENIRIGEELTVLCNSLRDQAAQKGLDLNLCCVSIPAQILTDKAKLEQILINIVGNAIKFTDQGEVRINVSLKKDKLTFDVSDTGVGIPVNQQDELFSAFTQADPSITRRFGGTGLGLALSRKLANLLGGDVFLKDSSAGTGSTFVIEIDAGKTDARELISFDNQYRSHRAAAARTSYPIINGLRILLAEDNEDLRRLISFQLRSAGASVDAVVNGQHAVERFRAKIPYDLVLIDVQMPVMDGYTAAKLIREMDKQTPLVACTARVMTEEWKLGQEVGMTDCIAKPLSLDAIVDVCVKHLHMSQRQPPAEKESVNTPSVYTDLFSDPELADLLRSMISRIPQYKNELIAAQFKSSDTVVKLVHKLKGMFASYGFSAVAEKLARLEGNVDNLSKAYLRDAVHEITLELDDIYRKNRPVEQGRHADRQSEPSRQPEGNRHP
ncbi:MAG: ATP-binding protein [Oligoflexales bacterium]